MERKRILFAVNNPPSVLDLRKSLIEVGYEVKIVDNGAAALALSREFRPHLICAELELSKIDGHHLFQELKAQSATKTVAFVLISRHRSVDERVHSINLGVDDYITIPFEVDEVLVRFEILLKEIETVEATPKKDSKGFSGKLSDLNLVELLQTLEIGQKSGIVILDSHDREGAIFIKEGSIVDASLAHLAPKEAIFRMITWDDGTFRVDFKRIEQEKVLDESTGDLLKQGFNHLNTWKKISAALPPLKTRLRPAPALVKDKLTNDQKSILEQIDEKRQLIDIIEASELADLEALKILANLYTKGALLEVPLEELRDNSTAERADKKKFPQGSKNKISSLVGNFLNAKGNQGSDIRIERRRSQRRKKENRRARPRRWSDFVSENPQIYLNKSELMMIREKLSNGKSGKKLTNRYN
ncbi:MAG: DUF4388 domain-containing protein [bacterium]